MVVVVWDIVMTVLEVPMTNVVAVVALVMDVDMVAVASIMWVA